MIADVGFKQMILERSMERSCICNVTAQKIVVTNKNKKCRCMMIICDEAQVDADGAIKLEDEVSVREYASKKKGKAAFSVEGRRYAMIKADCEFESCEVRKGWLDICNNRNSCFPGDALVETPSGFKLMSDLKVGDIVKGFDASTGNCLWSKVTTFLHYNPARTFYCKSISGSGFRVCASRLHRVMIRNFRDVNLNDLEVGDEICRDSGADLLHLAKIDTVELVVKVGVFCPLTQHGTIIVDGVAFSCFANLPHKVGMLVTLPIRFCVGVAPSIGLHWGTEAVLAIVPKPFLKWMGADFEESL